MSEHRIHLQPAFVLQSKGYRESSAILDVFTQDYGRITVLAKGARKAKSHLAGLLQPFVPLSISVTGRSELKTLTHCEILRGYQPLQGIAVYCGFYLNELLQHFLYRQDPHTEVFLGYNRCLLALADGNVLEMALRRFEIELLLHTGYGLQLTSEIDTGVPISPDKRYGFFPDRGAYEDCNGAFSGKTLSALQANDLSEADMGEAKKLMRLAIDHHLGGKTLKSRAFFARFVNNHSKGITQ